MVKINSQYSKLAIPTVMHNLTELDKYKDKTLTIIMTYAETKNSLIYLEVQILPFRK